MPPLGISTRASRQQRGASRTQRLKASPHYPQAVPLAEIAFLIGPLFGVILGPVALTVIVVSALRKQLRWLLWTGVILMFLLVVSTGIYWTVWGRAFNYVDGGHAVPARLELASDVTTSAAAIACVCLLISAVVAGHSRPR